MAGRGRIKEVAALAHVSAGTVSNVLNRPEIVSEQTRQRVLQAMTELNFVRDGLARQLRVGQSSTVGVIVRDLASSFYLELARGIEDRLALDDRVMMLCSSDENPEREDRFIRLFAEQGVQGILITPFRDESATIRHLENLHIPVVSLDDASQPCPSVSVDHIDGARQAVTHLLDQGHRRIGFLNGPLELRPCWERAEGVRQAITDHDASMDETIASITLSPLSADAGCEAMTTLLERHRLTAVFCVNDVVAMGALRALRRARLSVPGDVAVVGYDDIDFASELMVPLTSVRQPMHDLGWTAVDMLFNPPKDGHVWFRPQLVVRQSSSGLGLEDDVSS
jgi:LacI family transcriptional regulator